MDTDRTLSSHNIGFLEALYEQYEQDPESIDPQWRAVIERERDRADAQSSVSTKPRSRGNGQTERRTAVDLRSDAEQVALQTGVDKLIEHFRLLGHLRAHVDPLNRPQRMTTEALDLEYFGLGDEHLDREFKAGKLFTDEWVPLRDILQRLQRTYTRNVGVEYWQINEVEARNWLRDQMEPCENQVVPDVEEQVHLLRSLARADSTDRFIHNKFIGAKRFSVAGAESIIALLETLIEEAGGHGVRECIMGMAHRGRLSVMMNLMGLTPYEVFSRFEGGDPYENLGSGDVKYHLGSYRHHVSRSGREMYLALAFNPSHLEAITPVIAGRIRASQDRLPASEHNRVLGVTLHGDAAVMGQGVYAETLNLSGLPGYSNEGSIRVVINNQVGFTTNPEEDRTTTYCTAVADMLNVPIFHVNGDDPEAAAYVAKLAVQFRQRFHSDVIIDLCCYRRFGHNEGDEPTFTQPRMYELIKKLPSVRDQYQERLIRRGTVTQRDCELMDEELHEELEQALAKVRASKPAVGRSPMHGIWQHYRGGPDHEVPEAETKIDDDTVRRVAASLTRVPEGFNLHPKLKRLLKDATTMLEGKAPLSWALGEHLAYGSLVLEGKSVRLSGQDSIRGTFTHRHAAWVDTKTEQRHFPLQHIADEQGTFEAYNSPLSEFAVLGFEFGYSLAAPETLIIWEAQFGDFVNGAQVIIDQFLSSSEDKWNRISGLVLFLPHGYEGQGPEHSSARLERFLQLAAEDNMQVCNFTTPAQLFHALRRQIHRPWRKPLVVMTPKSLLRTRQSFSPLPEFTNGSFHRLIDDAEVDPTKVQRIMCCSGKVYYDLINARAERQRDDVAIVRVEQLYPFSAEAMARVLQRYGNATDLLWVQEEPKNSGAWTYMRPHLEDASAGRFAPRYVGRSESASPATGSPESHKLEQEMIMNDAFHDLGTA
jgi:2-oxoglutarate dehydrogenase E1 component